MAVFCAAPSRAQAAERARLQVRRRRPGSPRARCRSSRRERSGRSRSTTRSRRRRPTTRRAATSRSTAAASSPTTSRPAPSSGSPTPRPTRRPPRATACVFVAEPGSARRAARRRRLGRVAAAVRRAARRAARVGHRLARRARRPTAPSSRSARATAICSGGATSGRRRTRSRRSPAIASTCRSRTAASWRCSFEDGAPLWEYRLGGAPSDILALDDRLYVGSRDNFFYCLSTKDGTPFWRWRTGGDVIGMPARRRALGVLRVARQRAARAQPAQRRAALVRRAALPADGRAGEGGRSAVRAGPGRRACAASARATASRAASCRPAPSWRRRRTCSIAASADGPIVFVVSRDIAKGASVTAMAHSVEPAIVPVAPLPNAVTVEPPGAPPPTDRAEAVASISSRTAAASRPDAFLDPLGRRRRKRQPRHRPGRPST